VNEEAMAHCGGCCVINKQTKKRDAAANISFAMENPQKTKA
jgi:hypothetical protein